MCAGLRQVEAISAQLELWAIRTLLSVACLLESCESALGCCTCGTRADRRLFTGPLQPPRTAVLKYALKLLILVKRVACSADGVLEHSLISFLETFVATFTSCCQQHINTDLTASHGHKALAVYTLI